MSSDRFTEVTSTGLFGRLGQSIKGVVVGLILFGVAFPLLFWNEGRAVKRAKALSTGAKSLISVAADPIDPENDGKFVHVTGLATTDETLKDPDFNISADAIRLIRSTKMYQWKEEVSSKTRKKFGGGEETIKEYTYTKTWSSSVIDSDAFKQKNLHLNPVSMKYAGLTETARKVTLGEFTLPSSLVDRIDKTEQLRVDSDTLAELPPNLRRDLKVNNGVFYYGRDPQNPQIGDEQIEFLVVKPTTVSIAARQTGDSFEPYPAEGDELELFEMGIVSADGMIKSAEQQNKLMSWIWRAVGFFLMMFGIMAIFKPLTVTADVIPLLGDMLGFGVGLFAGIIAFALSMLTISVAWVFYRPLLGIPLVLVSVGILVAFKVLGLSRRGTSR